MPKEVQVPRLTLASEAEGSAGNLRDVGFDPYGPLAEMLKYP